MYSSFRCRQNLCCRNFTDIYSFYKYLLSVHSININFTTKNKFRKKHNTTQTNKKINIGEIEETRNLLSEPLQTSSASRAINNINIISNNINTISDNINTVSDSSNFTIENFSEKVAKLQLYL